MLKHALYLIVNILSCKAKFLVKHLVRSGETETIKSEDLAVRTYKSLKVDRKARSKSEDLCSTWQDLLLIALALAAEKSF